MSLENLFVDDPTRQLEEVQKVNAKERVAADVDEFHCTDSAAAVLDEVADIVSIQPHQDRRFLYMSATFGSGKTHLLKLIGLMAAKDDDFAHLRSQLAQEWPGFDRLRAAISNSHADRYLPVFLNLLSRDAAKEPPIPYLVYEAIGRELEYPTDPNWLLEWVWTLDRDYDGVWESITEATHDGKTFQDVLDERATLRQWLYAVVPTLDATTGTDLDSQADVKASIEAAESRVAPTEFDAAELVDRIDTVTDQLSTETQRTELLIGLDELALFVGDSTPRYREFEATMEALQNGPNPVVITTGQIPLTRIRETTVGSVPDGHWTHNEVYLEGADTETIVRKRWLEKTTDGQARLQDLLDARPDLSLETQGEISVMDPDAIESYPFREYDLTLLRSVMQELITDGKTTEEEYIQGRALLVLVRSLFTKFNWTDRSVGELVGWDTLFDLLVEETTYLPLWVQEVVANNVQPNVEERQVGVAKALYLINKTPKVPATPENVAKLTLPSMQTDLQSHIDRTHSDLETLLDNQCALTETSDGGETVYTLVSEEQKTILERAQEEASKIAPHQVSAKLETEFLKTDGFLRSEGARHTVTVGDNRLVPLRFSYSILDTVDNTASRNFDALQVRCYAGTDDQFADQVGAWQAANEGAAGGEDILVGITIPEYLIEDLKDLMGMKTVLETETEGHEQLEAKKNRKETRVEAELDTLLGEATLYTPTAERGSRADTLETVVSDRLEAEFGQTRRVLDRGLREVDDAKAMASFFRGSGEWPLSTRDAATLGVDTATRSLSPDGWAREFVDTHSGPVFGDSLIQETRRQNGAYRGTPRETLSALLMVLATSNADVQLKADDRLETPADIGREVRTTSKFEALEVRFERGIDHQRVREVVTTIRGEPPEATDPDAIVEEFGDWVTTHSGRIKETIKAARQFTAVELTTLEATLEPGYKGRQIAIADLDSETMVDEAATFESARALFEGPEPLWDEFTDVLSVMREVYPQAKVTSRLEATADSDRVPTQDTVEQRLSDAIDHRRDALETQLERCFDSTPTETTPAALCTAFSEQLEASAEELADLVEWGETTFDAVALPALRSLVDRAGESIEEATIVDSQLRGEAETLQQLRALYTGDPGLWDQLEAAAESLASEQPDSPTTDRVWRVLDDDNPPSASRVEDLLEEAEDPKPPRPDGEVWGQLEEIHDRLREELPSASLTTEIAAMIDDGADEHTEATVKEALADAESLLERWQRLQSELDELPDGTTVRIESR